MQILIIIYNKFKRNKNVHSGIYNVSEVFNGSKSTHQATTLYFFL